MTREEAMSNENERSDPLPKMDHKMWSVVETHTLADLDTVISTLNRLVQLAECQDANGYDPEYERALRTVLAGAHEVKGRAATMLGGFERARAEFARGLAASK